MRIKKKNVLKESYLINEAILLDQLTHIKPNVKKVLKLLYKKYVPKNDETFYWWQLSQFEIEEFLEEDMGIPYIHAHKISKFFVKYGEKIFEEMDDFVYDIPMKDIFERLYNKYIEKFIKDENVRPDIMFKININGKQVVFDEPYDVWSSFKGVTLYVSYYRDQETGNSTSIMVKHTFDFNGGGENTISIDESYITYELDGQKEKVELLPKGTEIDLPKDDSYESFVEWMQELILSTKTVLSTKNINL